MARIGVQSEDPRQVSTAVRAGSAEVSDTLGRPTSQIQDLAARWEGAASEEFQTRRHDWQAGASQVQQAMEAMGVFREQAAQTCETTEDELCAAASR